ncbi:MAG: DUF1967 domain-containing protein [Microthrixaceae bacterium]
MSVCSALGVDRALARAGARTGDQVRIGTMSFEYEAADEINFADQSTRRSASKRKGSRG